VTQVAVVIPNRDGRDVVGASVAAAFAAGAADVVVVDDGSVDGSPAEAWAAGARVLPSPGRGFSAAVNAGAAATSEPFLLLLNSDCFLEPDALRALRAALTEDPDLALCGASLLEADGSPAKSCGALVSLGSALLTPFGRGARGAAPAEHGVQRVPFVPLPCVLARRADWDAVGGLDDGYVFYFEDYDLCWRLGERGRGIAVCWEARATHVGGASSSARDPQRWFTQYHASRARYLRKRYGPAFVVYALLWPPLALLHALRWRIRGGEAARRWASAYVAAATAGLSSRA
jgi:GT2 family glycosyltransferase